MSLGNGKDALKTSSDDSTMLEPSRTEVPTQDPNLALAHPLTLVDTTCNAASMKEKFPARV